MENQEMKESKAPHSSGTNICSRNKGMQIPCKGQKCFKNAKVKFLTMEEVIKLGSAAQTAKRVSHSKRSPQSKPSESLPTISKRTRTVAKTAASKCQSGTKDKKCSSTVFQRQQGIKLKREDDSRPKKEAVLGLNKGKGVAEIQGNSSHLISSHTQKYTPNGPALEAIWKGNFEVLDGPYVGLNERFSAHLASKISLEAYNCSKQMAGVLQLKIHPRHAYWPKMFQTDAPTENVIALYFYPAKIERSRKKYSSLLKYMEKNDLVLKSHMGHVVLLIYPSTLLSKESQKLDGSYFMWGVFSNPEGSLIH